MKGILCPHKKVPLKGKPVGKITVGKSPHGEYVISLYSFHGNMDLISNQFRSTFFILYTSYLANIS